MGEQLLSQLLDFGALGIFAAFLVWQHIGMQRRMDDMSSQFTETLTKMNADYDARIEAMRERYGDVIENIREEAKTSQREFLASYSVIRETVVERLAENAAKLDALVSREPPS